MGFEKNDRRLAIDTRAIYYLEIDGERFELGTGETTIGRSRTCFITLRDPSASRTHLTVTVDDSGARVQDMGSSNGTHFNGHPLSDVRGLQAGDRLTIGETELVFGLDQVQDVKAVEDSPSATVRVQLALVPCTQCGIDLAKGTAICPRCGQDQNEVVVSAGAAEVAVDPELPTASPAPPLVSEVASSDSPSNTQRPAPPAPEAAPAVPPPPVAPLVESVPPPAPAPPPIGEVEFASAPRAAAVPSLATPMAGAVSPVDNPEFNPPAGFWIRLLAWVVDGAWMSLVMILASFLLPGSIQSIVSMILSLILGVGVPIIGWGHFGTTPGKRLFKLYVCTVEGEVGLGYGRAALRWVGYMVSFLLVGIGFIMIGLTPAKRGLHDHLAGSYVCRR